MQASKKAFLAARKNNLMILLGFGIFFRTQTTKHMV